MSLKEEMIYISGMLEALNLTSGEGAVITRMANVMSDMAAKIEELEERTALLSEDVQDVSDIALGLDEDDDADDDEITPEEIAALCNAALEDDDTDDDYDDIFGDEFEDAADTDVYLRCTCPECNKPFYVKEEQRTDDTLFTCPSCNAKVKAVADFEADEEFPVAEPVTEEE